MLERRCSAVFFVFRYRLSFDSYRLSDKFALHYIWRLTRQMKQIIKRKRYVAATESEISLS